MVISLMATLLFVLLSFIPAFTSGAVIKKEDICVPQHVHISYGDSWTEMVIMWATRGNCSTQLDYGRSEQNLRLQAHGKSVEFQEQNARGLQYLHRVKLIDLDPSTTYYYRPLSNKTARGPFNFKVPKSGQNFSAKLLVFGDMGVQTMTIPTLVKEALTGEYTALLHIGDFAYNLKDEDGLIGDKFFEHIEPVAAFLPYMTCPGNHEIDGETFTQYKHRFSMPESPWPMSPEKMWYSFDVGPIHFISYSTEVFFTMEGKMVQRQLDWLQNDLKMANAQRSTRPWIIAFGHRPLYCSANDGDDCTKEDSLVRAGLEDLFYHSRVDVVLQAHEHNYERLYPVYKGAVLAYNYTNPPAPVQIITGAAGSSHLWNAFKTPPKPKWSAVRIAAQAFNSFGILRVTNGSHAYWEQRSVHNSTVLDSLWIIQEGRYK